MLNSKYSILIGWLVCTVSAILYCYEFLLRIEPSVMVPELMHHFKVTASTIGMMTAIYYYAYTPLQLVVGILVDRYGTRFILTFAIIACALGSFMFGAASSLYLASIGRFLIGFGSAFVFVGVLKLATEWLPKRHFALFTGFTTALAMLGAMGGDVGLTAVLHDFGVERTLYIATIMGVILIPVVFIFVRNAPPQWKQVHREEKISFRKTFRGFWQIVKNPQMWLAGTVACLYYLSLSLFAELWGIPFLRAVYNLDPEMAAFVCSMVFVGWLIGAPLSGWLSDRYKTRKIPLIIGGFCATLVITVIVLKPFSITLTALEVLLFLFGVFSSTEIVCFAIGRENNSIHIAATAVGFTNLLTMVGGMVFQPLVGVLLDKGWHGEMLDGVRAYSMLNFQHAFLILPMLVFLGALLTLFLQETYYYKGKL